MATSGTKLVMKFGTPAGPKTHTINYAKNTATVAQINTLMNAIIANGSIYKNTPLTKESAELVVSTVTKIDVNS